MSSRVLVFKIRRNVRLNTYVPPTAPDGSHIRTTKVPASKLTAFAAMPILSGGFQMSMSLEGFPAAALNIENIHPKDLSAYKAFYARINKEFTFYGVPFLVYSYSENLQSDIVNGQNITRHSLTIQFRSKWELLGGRTLLLSQVNNSIETYLRKRVSLTELSQSLDVPYRGPNILVRLPDANDLTGEVFTSFNGQMQSYLRINGCYADYTQPDAVYARELMWGNSYTMSSWDVVYQFPIQQNTPFVFRRATVGVLYETFDQEEADEGLLSSPQYVRNVLPSYFLRSGDLSGRELFQDNSAKSPFLTGEQAGPTLTFRESLFSNGALVQETTDVLSYIFTMRTADVNWARWQPISVSFVRYEYAPLSISRPFATVRARTGEVVPVFLIDSAIQLPPETRFGLPVFNIGLQILSGITSTTINWFRYISESNALGRDLQVVENLIEEKQSLIQKMTWDISQAIGEEDDEETRRLRYEKALMEAEIKMLRAKAELMDYTTQRTTSRGTIDAVAYPEPPNRNLPFSVFRVRPGVFAESLASLMTVDSQGFAYVGWINPAWVPPMYVAEEVRESGGAGRPRNNPDQIMVQFQRETERLYLEERLQSEFDVTSENPFGDNPEEEPPDPAIIDIVRRLAEIEALEDRPKLHSGSYDSYRVRRELRNTTRRVTDPRTGQQREEPFEMYNEFIREVKYQGPDARTAILNTRSSENVGRPPAPTIIAPDYVLLDASLRLPPRYLWYVRSKDYDNYRYVGDIDKTQQDGENLGSYPTTSYAKAKVAVETDLSIRHWQDFKTSNLTLFGMHEYLRPGDYLNITDIPELRPRAEEGVLRVTTNQFAIRFDGIDPLGDIAAQCQSTNIGVGCFRKREIEVVERIFVPRQDVTNEDVVSSQTVSVSYGRFLPPVNSRRGLQIIT